MSGARAYRAEPIEFSLTLELWGEVVEDWALDAGEVHRLLGETGQSIDGIAGRDLGAVERMRLLVDFAPVAAELLGGPQAVRHWLRRPNPQMRGTAPLDRMAADPAWVRFMLDGLGAML